MLAYWGLGLHWGKAVSQNAKGHILGHVKVRPLKHDQDNAALQTCLRCGIQIAYKRLTVWWRPTRGADCHS